MRNLVVGYREGGARARVENLMAHFIANLNESMLPQNPVDVYRLVHRHYAIFRKHNHLRTARLIKADQVAAYFVNRFKIARNCRIGGSSFCKL